MVLWVGKNREVWGKAINVFLAKQEMSRLAKPGLIVCSWVKIGICCNQAQKATGNPRYPPNDSTASGFSLCKICQAEIKPSGKNHKFSSVLILKERVNRPA